MGMMKKIFAVILFILTVILTVLLVQEWMKLNTERQDFTQLAAKVADERRKTEKVPLDAKQRETVTGGDGIEGNRAGILPEYQELILENPDFAGWVVIDGTAVNYPVMQTPEDVEYYLHRDFSGKDSYAGTPFVGTGDLQSLDDDIFIYGHNMKNGTMFADILCYQEKEFWETHQTIQLDNRSDHGKYLVFTALFVGEEEWVEREGLFSGCYAGRREEWIERLIDTGLYKTSADPGIHSRLLFLVTCRQKGRFVVAAFKES